MAHETGQTWRVSCAKILSTAKGVKSMSKWNYARIMIRRPNLTDVKYYAFLTGDERDKFIENFKVPEDNHMKVELVSKEPYPEHMVPILSRHIAIATYKLMYPRYQDFHVNGSFLVRQSRGHSGPHHWIEVTLKLRVEVDAKEHEDVDIESQFDRLYEILHYHYGNQT